MESAIRPSRGLLDDTPSDLRLFYLESIETGEPEAETYCDGYAGPEHNYDDYAVEEQVESADQSNRIVYDGSQVPLMYCNMIEAPNSIASLVQAQNLVIEPIETANLEADSQHGNLYFFSAVYVTPPAQPTQPEDPPGGPVRSKTNQQRRTTKPPKLKQNGLSFPGRLLAVLALLAVLKIIELRKAHEGVFHVEYYAKLMENTYLGNSERLADKLLTREASLSYLSGHVCVSMLDWKSLRIGSLEVQLSKSSDIKSPFKILNMSEQCLTRKFRLPLHVATKTELDGAIGYTETYVEHCVQKPWLWYFQPKEFTQTSAVGFLALLKSKGGEFSATAQASYDEHRSSPALCAKNPESLEDGMLHARKGAKGLSKYLATELLELFQTIHLCFEMGYGERLESSIPRLLFILQLSNASATFLQQGEPQHIDMLPETHLSLWMHNNFVTAKGTSRSIMDQLNPITENEALRRRTGKSKFSRFRKKEDTPRTLNRSASI